MSCASPQAALRQDYAARRFRSLSQTAAWKPQKNVEFIVPTSAGSTMDLLARVIQDIWQKRHLMDMTMTMQAKPGGGGAFAWTYVSRETGDGHYIAISGPTLLANDVLGVGTLKYKDVTPIAQLFTEYEVFAVNAEQSDQDRRRILVNALKSPSRHRSEWRPALAAPVMSPSSNLRALPASMQKQADDRAIQRREQVGAVRPWQTYRCRDRDRIGRRAATCLR